MFLFYKMNKIKINKKEIYDCLECNNLVTYDEFENYLTTKSSLFKRTSIYKKFITDLALIIKQKRYKNYKNIESNCQFISINKSNYFINPELILLLQEFIGELNTEMVFTMIRYNKNDEEILNFIKLNYDYKYKIFGQLYKIQKISREISRYFLNYNKKIKILDVGTGNGKKIKQIKKYIEPSIDCEIYGVDIAEWGGYGSNRKFDFPFKTIKMNPYHIPHPDKTFDCITLILVLHHSEDIIVTINECRRILKDDGLLILIEHDIWTDEKNMLVDIQHRIYSKINDETYPIKSTYFNFIEWDILFDKCNMKLHNAHRLSENPAFTIKYDVQIYHAYIKKLTN